MGYVRRSRSCDARSGSAQYTQCPDRGIPDTREISGSFETKEFDSLYDHHLNLALGEASGNAFVKDSIRLSSPIVLERRKASRSAKSLW
jgi:hypothetical protein